MEKREIGTSGIMTSPLGLGSVKFGRNQGVKYPNAFDLPEMSFLQNFLALAKDNGINLIDTAPAYGLSEERLGALLKGQRHDWIVISKAGEEFNTQDNSSYYDFSPEHFEASLKRSLKRLNTDYIDVFLIHSDGNDTDNLHDDLIEKMHEFKQKGLVKVIGASTKTYEGGLKALQNLDVVMATYRSDYLDEKAVLDYAHETKKSVFLKKVLASGHEKNIEKALAFSLSHPSVCSSIIGTINHDHFKQNLHAIK